MRISAISQLGWHRAEPLTPLIAACASDPDPRVRAFVAHALARTPGIPQPARGALELLASDRDGRVRDAARKALALI